METSELKPPTPMAAQVLRLVGAILIISFVLDLAVLLLIAAQFGNPQWELNVVNQLVDRGVIPLIGFALLHAGNWVQANNADNKPRRPGSPWQDGQFWAFIVASLAGLLFLLAIPANFSITGQLANAAIEQVNQQASQQEAQITQEQSQLKTLVASGQAAQMLKSNQQLQPQQRDLLTRAVQNPQALDQQAKKLLDDLTAKKNQAIAQANAEATQNRIRVSLRSLLMALGFTFIGWSGLRDSR